MSTLQDRLKEAYHRENAEFDRIFEQSVFGTEDLYLRKLALGFRVVFR